MSEKWKKATYGHGMAYKWHKPTEEEKKRIEEAKKNKENKNDNKRSSRLASY